MSFCIKSGLYPDLWKVEMVTPVPKVHPPEKLEDLRKISWLINCSKVTDKLIVELVMEDMKPTLDSREMRRRSQHSTI